MNIEKLMQSFILLLIMVIIQFLTCFFVLHHILLSILSIGAAILCIAGIAYTSHQASKK